MLCVGQSLCAGSLPFLPGPTSLGEPGLFCPLVIRAVPGSSWAHRCPSPHLPAAPVRSRPPTVAEPIVAGNVFAYCTAICSLYHPGFRFSDTNYHCSTDFSGLLFVCMPAARLSTARTSVLKAYLTPVCVCVCMCVCVDAWGDLHRMSCCPGTEPSPGLENLMQLLLLVLSFQR